MQAISLTTLPKITAPIKNSIEACLLVKSASKVNPASINKSESLILTFVKVNAHKYITKTTNNSLLWANTVGKCH